MQSGLKMDHKIVRLWKHWLLYFLGTGKRNYTTEAVNMLHNIKCDFPAHIVYIAIHNCGVNMSGVEGCAKPSLMSTIICFSNNINVDY